MYRLDETQISLARGKAVDNRTTLSTSTTLRNCSPTRDAIVPPALKVSKAVMLSFPQTPPLREVLPTRRAQRRPRLRFTLFSFLFGE